MKEWDRASVKAIGGLHLGFALAVVWFIFGTFSRKSWILAIALFAITGLSVSVGYHRLATHLSFKAGRVVKWFLFAGAALSLQGNVYDWVANHRLHHAKQDQPGLDPHTPYEYDGWKGLGWAHMGWLLFKRKRPEGFDVLEDLESDKVVLWHRDRYWVFVLASFLIPLYAGLDGLILAGFARQVVTLHVTWSVNSFGHKWGTRPRDSKRRVYRKRKARSRNNFLLGILGAFWWGECWHGNHHAFPNLAYLGWWWWQIDPGKYLIRTMELLRLVWDVHKPSRDMLFPESATAAS